MPRGHKKKPLSKLPNDAELTLMLNKTITDVEKRIKEAKKSSQASSVSVGGTLEKQKRSQKKLLTSQVSAASATASAATLAIVTEAHQT